MTRKLPRDINWLIKNYMSFFKQYGMEEGNIRSYYETWSKDRPALIGDYLWHIFQTLLIETAKQAKSESKMYSLHADIYLEMAMYRRKEEKAKANEIMQLFHDCRIKSSLLGSNLVCDVIIISGHCCEYCDSLNQKLFPPEKVLKNKYLASDKCTREYGCNCSYAFEALRDKDDNLIRQTKRPF